MPIFLLIRKNLRLHALSTAVTAGSIALAGGLLMSLWVIKDQTHQTFTGMTGGFDAVLGARGAKLQLVLNAVFHLDESPGNIRWEDYQQIQNHPGVALAVPIAVGDNYRGYRLVGTTSGMFEEAEYSPGKRLAPAPPGRLFDPGRREALVGSFAAHRLGLKPGDTFHPYHGLIFDEQERHAETYVVVGILEPSNTPADRVIWIPLEGLQKMSGHAAETATDVSAVLVRMRTPVMAQSLNTFYNRQGDRLTFAWPIGQVMGTLLARFNWVDQVLALTAYLVALVAIASVMASIYNSMNERRRSIAILRSLGARQMTVCGSIVLESMTIAAIGMALAFAVYLLITSLAAQVIRAQTGVVLDPFALHAVMAWTPAAVIAASGLAGIVPAIKAYRTDVASYLAGAV